MSIIFDIEYKTIITPIDVIKATPPILGFTIIIKPHNIDIIEQINIEIQLLYPFLHNNIDILKSKVDFVIIIIPVTIGNNVFIIFG